MTITPVVWFFTFAALVVSIKWLVLSSISPGRTLYSTCTYLSWWYVNATLKHLGRNLRMVDTRHQAAAPHLPSHGGSSKYVKDDAKKPGRRKPLRPSW